MNSSTSLTTNYSISSPQIIKKPIIGEKPFCAIHAEKCYSKLCTSKYCEFRVLCPDCEKNHELYQPDHLTQIINLNDWHKYYKNIAKYFDPRHNYSSKYLIDEIGMILRKKVAEIENHEHIINDAFTKLLQHFLDTLTKLKEEMETLLWKKYKKLYNEYLDICKKFNENHHTANQNNGGSGSIHNINNNKNNRGNLSRKTTTTLSSNSTHESSNNNSSDLYDEIFKIMKEDLPSYFKNGELKSFFNKVFEGQYDKEYYSKLCNYKDLQDKLENIRKKIGKGFRTFDFNSFETIWKHEQITFLNNFQNQMKNILLPMVRSDVIPSKTSNPKFMINGYYLPPSPSTTLSTTISTTFNSSQGQINRVLTHSNSGSMNTATQNLTLIPNYICKAHIETENCSFLASINNDLILACSDKTDDRILKIYDAGQNCRSIHTIDCGYEGGISSVCILKYKEAETEFNEINSTYNKDPLKKNNYCNYTKRTKNKNTIELILLGRNEDAPHIELWDWHKNCRIAIKENAHDYGISVLTKLKEIQCEDDPNLMTFYVASGSCDEWIRIWIIDIKKKNNISLEFESKIELLKAQKIHTDYISNILSIPQCKSVAYDTILSISHDKSINFWEWNKPEFIYSEVLLEEEDSDSHNYHYNTPKELNNNSIELSSLFINPSDEDMHLSHLDMHNISDSEIMNNMETSFSYEDNIHVHTNNNNNNDIDEHMKAFSNISCLCNNMSNNICEDDLSTNNILSMAKIPINHHYDKNINEIGSINNLNNIDIFNKKNDVSRMSNEKTKKTKNNFERELYLQDDVEEINQQKYDPTLQILHYGYRMPLAHSDRINSVVLITDEEDYNDLELFITGGGEGLIKIWDIRKKKLQRVISNNHRSIFSMVYLGNGRLVTTGNESNIKQFHIYIWDIKNGSLLLKFKDHKSRILKLQLLENGELASIDKQKILKIWKIYDDDEKQKYILNK